MTAELEPSRLQAFLRASVARSTRRIVRVPPFVAYLDRHDPLRYLNYAIPEGDVEPERATIDALRAAFRQHGRLPRLEWVEEAAPRLWRALEVAGMQEELRTPLMACRPDALLPVEAALPGARAEAVADADVRELSAMLRVAFGQAPLAPDVEPRDPRPSGAGAVLVRHGGEVISGAVWTRVIDGVSEVAGVATAEAWRQRGLGGVVTAAAARAAFAAGASLCVLSPGDEAAQRVYARAGFRRVATMLHAADMDAPPA